jgi:hypothetical protein
VALRLRIGTLPLQKIGTFCKEQAKGCLSVHRSRMGHCIADMHGDKKINSAELEDRLASRVSAQYMQ